MGVVGNHRPQCALCS